MDAIQPPPLACSAATAAAEESAAKDLDIAILVFRGLGSRLDSWRTILRRYHLLIVIEDKGELDDVKKRLAGLDFDLHTAGELDRSGIATATSAVRSLALLASTRRYVAFLDLRAAIPATDPASNEAVDPFRQHLANLRSPSTPFFFNTLYDPFRPGADFVRGYPFSLRTGVATAISHGLWLDPGKTAAAVDAVLTVPLNAFFAMRSINVALDRELIGVAMFLGFGDVWAGLCAKRICDHLQVGVKSGLPYVAATSSGVEEGGEEVADCEMVDFLRGVELPKDASAVDCYEEIVGKIKSDEPKFAQGMPVAALEAWVGAWKAKQKSKGC